MSAKSLTHLLMVLMTIILLAFGMVSCSGGTRGTGASIDRTLVAAPDNLVVERDNNSWSGFLEPSCSNGHDQAKLKIKVSTEFGLATIVNNSDLLCSVKIPLQSEQVKIIFSSLPRGIKNISYTLGTLACGQETNIQVLKQGAIAIENGSIRLPAIQGKAGFLQSFRFNNPNKLNEVIRVDLMPETEIDCEAEK